jgi:hypothetical protein
MAAAPELYGALCDLVYQCSVNGTFSCIDTDDAEAAISKARGDAQKQSEAMRTAAKWLSGEVEEGCLGFDLGKEISGPTGCTSADKCRTAGESIFLEATRVWDYKRGIIMTYQPKGSMCSVCKHKLEDCSKLPFNAMPAMNKSNGVTVVRCTEFKQDIKGATDNERIKRK